MNSLTGYAQAIAKATKRTDPHELRLIEDCMRHDIFHSTLDWQTLKQFNRGAREAVKVLKETGELK